MSPRKPDIIFTEPVQHHETPREKLYGSRRRKNLKRSFGMAAMLFGIGALLMFVFPLVTFPIGFLGLIIGIVAIGIKTDGQGIGHHMAMVGLLASVVSIILTCVFWVVNVKKKDSEAKTRDEKQVELIEQVSGVWKSNEDNDVTIEFTRGGNIIYSELASEAEDAQPLREIAGLYTVGDRELVMAFGSQSTKFTYEFTSPKQLRLLAPSDHDIRLGLGGNWRKVMTVKNGIDYETASEELKQYFEQLDQYTQRKKTLVKTLQKYTKEKKEFVSQLNDYTNKGKARDDKWRIVGRELKSVNGTIDLIKERIATVDNVIVRLQGVIRNQGREEDIARLGMNEDELIDLLATSLELEDQLKLDREIELLNDAEVEEMLNDAREGQDDIHAVEN